MQFSLELSEDSRENLDIELDNTTHADFFEAVMESLIPNLNNKPTATPR